MLPFYLFAILALLGISSTLPGEASADDDDTMNERIVLLNDLSQSGDCIVELLLVDQLLDFVVPRVNIAHQKGL